MNSRASFPPSTRRHKPARACSRNFRRRSAKRPNRSRDSSKRLCRRLHPENRYRCPTTPSAVVCSRHDQSARSHHNAWRAHSLLRAGWPVSGQRLTLTHPIFDLGAATREIGSSLLIGAGCFAFVVPTLITLGFIYLAVADPKHPRPTVQQAISLIGAVYTAHFVFLVGFAAFLRSVSWILTVIFIAACYLALRRYKKICVDTQCHAASRGDRRKEGRRGRGSVATVFVIDRCGTGGSQSELLRLGMELCDLVS